MTSTNLLVGGFPLPSGHMMRHFGESVAMALLCLDSDSQVFEEFQRLGAAYSADAAVSKLKRRRQWQRIERLISAPEDGWDTFATLNGLWSHFSHAGAFALGFHMKFAASNALVVGPEFDPDKAEQFLPELRWRRSGFDVLRDIVRSATPRLAPPTP